jgi:hypothetical protein
MAIYLCGSRSKPEESGALLRPNFRIMESIQEGARAMSTQATGTFQMKSWDEKPIAETEGAPKLTHTSTGYSYSGALTGDGTSDGTIFYTDDAHASFIAMERIVGSIGDRKGSFVLQQSGTYEGMVARWSATIIPGSGTGDLRGIQGRGSFTAKHGDENHSYTLEVEFE